RTEREAKALAERAGTDPEKVRDLGSAARALKQIADSPISDAVEGLKAAEQKTAPAQQADALNKAELAEKVAAKELKSLNQALATIDSKDPAKAAAARAAIRQAENRSDVHDALEQAKQRAQELNALTDRAKQANDLIDKAGDKDKDNARGAIDDIRKDLATLLKKDPVDEEAMREQAAQKLRDTAHDLRTLADSQTDRARDLEAKEAAIATAPKKAVDAQQDLLDQ